METMRGPMRVLRIAVCGTLAIPIAQLAPPAWGAPPAPLEGWTKVRYTTSKLLIFSGDLTMDRTTTADRICVRTETRARLFGSPFVDTWSVSTMDRKTGRPIDFFDVRPKKKAERFTFSGAGILHETLKPRKESPNDPIEKWRTAKRETLPVDPSVRATSLSGGPGTGTSMSSTSSTPSTASISTTSASGGRAATPSSTAIPAQPSKVASGTGAPSPGGAPAPDPPAAAVAIDPARWVHDYIAMIVRLHDLPLHKVGDQATVRVLTSQGGAPMRVRVSEERTVRRDLTDLATGKSTSMTFRELRLRVTPLAGSASDTKGFMNMEGETELWVEAATRTLMEISGEVPKVPGRVDIVIAGFRK